MNGAPQIGKMMDFDAARAILRGNDLGTYTVPTKGLYPFQWNWDSAFTALGWLTFEEGRAWKEAQAMFSGQWDNGMVPHILFHGPSDSYFPGPGIWGAESGIPSSTISQPPVWATAITLMLQRSSASSAARAAVRDLLPRLIDYHLWWYRDRDLDNTGLVESYHPWESGMDNSPAWDAPLARVPRVEWGYQRRDLNHVDQAQRPSDAEYDRYLHLIELNRRHRFEPRRVAPASPYRVIDIGTVAILQRATHDLIDLCREFGQEESVPELEAELVRTGKAARRCWSGEYRCFLNWDKISDAPLREHTTAALLPLFGHLADASQAGEMASLTEQWLAASEFSLASTHPRSPFYEPQRYWRGPVWLHVNWMIADGLRAYGYTELADRIKQESRKCIMAAGGYYEYFNSETGKGCGGTNFSWTAAVALFWFQAG